MEWFIQLQLQQATKQCLTEIKEFPHVHVWADTTAIFFKLNTTVLSNEGRINISALYAQKHFSKKGLKNPHTELS